MREYNNTDRQDRQPDGTRRCRAEFAVLMPTFGRRETLKTSILSVVGQKFGDWVLVVVNDGGPCVRDIVESVNDERVFYFSRPHLGKSAALNFALSVSQSEFVAYLDDDDLFFENHLQVCHTALGQNPGCGAVCTQTVEGFWNLDGDGRVVNLKHRGVVYPGGFSRFELREKNRIPNLNVAHRRCLLEKSGLNDPELFALIDWDLWRRLSFFTDFCTAPVPTGMYKSAIGRTNNIGSLVQKDPASHERIKRYIQSRLPGISRNILLGRTVSAPGQGNAKRMLVCVCGEIDPVLQSGLDRQDAEAGSFDVVSLAGESFGGNGFADGFDLVCFLLPGMSVRTGFVSSHLNAKREGCGAVCGRIDVPIKDGFDFRGFPALFSLVFSSREERFFYFVSNLLCLFNMSFNPALLGDCGVCCDDPGAVFGFLSGLGQVSLLADEAAVARVGDVAGLEGDSTAFVKNSVGFCGAASVGALAACNEGALAGFFSAANGAGVDFECARRGAVVENALYESLKTV